MTMQPVGVALTTSGEASFLSALNSATKAVQSFAGQSEQSSKSVSMLGDIITGAFIGNMAVQAVNAITGAIFNLGNQALSSAEEMQKLRISLESLAAREIMKSGGVTDMTQAFKEAGPVTENLMRQIRDLSLVSPFEYQDVIQVFRMNMAFGQTSETSIGLTKAILDMASAGGHGAYMMQRVAYNFSQMAMTGRVTMRDVRDLALAGVDLAAVFRDELGMSIQEVDTQLKGGKMTFEEVSKAFVEYADKNFGGAAARMSQTLSGLKSSFNDLLTFTSIDVLGPALERITAAANNLFAALRQIVDAGVLKDIGTLFDQMIGIFVAKAPEMPAATDQALIDIRTQFQDAALDAVEWGANIVTSLAEGMIMGVSAVVSAIGYISGVIASWLMGHSPPKALPDLPDWGKGAMVEYLKGFTEADFSVLDSIQGPLKQILSLTGNESAFAGISEGLAQALSGKGVPSNLFSDVAGATGPFADELNKLIKSQLELSSATDAVKASEEALNKARQDEINAFRAVDSEINKYNEMLRKGASKDELRAQKDLVNGKAKDASASRKARVQAESDYEIAQKNLKLMQDQVKLQDQLIKQLIELSQRSKDAAGGGLGGITPPVLTPGMPSIDKSPLEKSLEELGWTFKYKITQIFAQMKADIQTAWDNSAIGNLWEQVAKLLGLDQKDPLGDFLGLDQQGPQDGGLKQFFESVFGVKPETAQALTDLFTQVGDFFQKVFTKENIQRIAQAAGFVGGLVGSIGLLALVIGIATNPWAWLIGAIATTIALWPQITEGANLLATAFSTNLTTGLKAFWGGLNDLSVAITVWGVRKIRELGVVIAEWLQKEAPDFVDWLTKITAPDGPLATMKDWFDKIVTSIGNMTTNILDLLKDPAKGLKTWYDTFTADAPGFKSVIDGIAGAFKGVSDFIGGVVKGIQDVIDGFEKLRELNLGQFESHSPTPFEMGLRGISDAMREMTRQDLPRMDSELRRAGRVSHPINAASIQASQSSAGNLTMNMGGVVINDKMDRAVFETWVRRVVSDALGA